jgi:hypothetical protein
VPVFSGKNADATGLKDIRPPTMPKTKTLGIDRSYTPE